MRLGDLIREGGVHLGLPGKSLADGVAKLLAAAKGEPPDSTAAETLIRKLAGGEGGALLRVSLTTLIVGLPVGEDEEGRVEIGVASSPLPFGDDPTDPGPRIVLLCPISRRGDVEARTFTKLAGVLRDPEIEASLLEAKGVDEVLSLQKLMDTNLNDPLRVKDVLVPFTDRVFAETPLAEVIGLMSRTGLSAVAVVDEDLQLVGMIRVGEALKHALQRAGQGEAEAGRRLQGTAREVMSRTVMSVSEDQDLLDAAWMMVNREVAQLPVMRGGEIVGIVSRDAVMRALFSGW
jgi:CBS domain-containing protein